MKISKLTGLIFLFILNSFLYSEESLTVTIGGDVMLDRGIRKEIRSKGYSAVFNKYRQYFAGSDYGIVNLESAVTATTEKTPKQFNFRIDKEALDSLRSIGITHVNLANNHTIDFGECGLKETIENAEKADLVPLGFSNSGSDFYPPITIEKKGIRVAVFSSVMLRLPDYHWDTCSNYSICHHFAKELIKEIGDYRKKNPNDHILVLLHWGWEDTAFARQSQTYEAEMMIKSGADLIVGCHPHVIQNIRKIKSKYVFFSIGNMIFDGKSKKGMILKIKFLKHKKIRIKRYIIG